MKFITSLLPLLLAITAYSKKDSKQGECIKGVENYGCNMSNLIAELTLDHLEYACEMYKLEECQYLQYYGVRDIEGCTDDDPEIYEYDDFVTRVLDQVELLCSLRPTATTTSKKHYPTSTVKERCGPAFGSCAIEGECCSQHGYCGSSADHCGTGCQSDFGVCVSDNFSQFETSVVVGRCGPYYGICAGENECCSKDGYCDTTPDHCGVGCQPIYGICDSTKNTTTVKKTTTTTTIPKPSPTSDDNDTDGRCGPEFGKCKGKNECCSQYGYCDTTPEHCGAGCQPEYGICDSDTITNTTIKKITTTTTAPKASPTDNNGRCGPEFGKCKGKNECCSEYGYCDNTPEHCGAGCQPEFGICNVAPTTTTKKNVPVSTVSGRCGPDYGKCAGKNECCSEYGYCDNSPAHCGAGCQPEFGICNATATTTKKTTTTTKKTTIKKTTTTNKNIPVSTVSGRCGPEFGKCKYNDQCCSKYGYCDNSPAHCGAGCQSEYGICN